MNEKIHKEAIQELIREKFRGHDILISKYTPIFPASIEREYMRIFVQYMKLLKESIEEEIPVLKEQIMRERGTYHSNYKVDGVYDILYTLEKVLNKIERKFLQKESGYGLKSRLEELASLTRKLTVREWKKAVNKTLGIDIMEDYYLGDFFQSAIEEWVNENVSLIKTIPTETLSDMRIIVKGGFTAGKSTTAIMKEIQHKYNIEKNHAKFIARDQIGKLNATVTEVQQRDAGIEEYIWCDCGDSRVRSSHKALNGKRFRWDNPPVVDKKGRRCHPGQDYQCRCRPKPVFRFSTFCTPIAERKK